MQQSALVGGIALSLLLAGCATGPSGPRPEPVPLSEVIRQIKYEINAYNQSPKPVSGAAACPGDVDLAISKVKISFGSTIARKGSAGLELAVPVGPVDVGGKSGTASSATSTQAVELTLFPAADQSGGPLTSADRRTRFEGLQIAALLQSVREELTRNKDITPCLSAGSPEKQDNKLKFGFTVDKSASAGASLQFLIFKLGTEQSRSASALNTVEVTFVISGAAMLVPQ